jgi:hypothetical protein
MPDLIKSLQGRDLGHLRIVAELWGIDFEAPDMRTGLQRLAPCLLNRERVEEEVSDLPSEARRALYALLHSPEERMRWAQFARRFGSVREMGSGRRDRDRPYLNPVSPAEALWYRGLVGRAFFDTNSGPEEFAYIPDDLAALLPAAPGQALSAMGRAATPSERAHVQLANDRLLDHACTLLAALRMGFAQAEIEALEPNWNPAPHGAPLLTAKALRALLAAAGLLDPDGVPLPEPTRLFLESSRPQALAQLAGAWLHTPMFNELRLLPGVVAEGEWQNDPVRARQSVLDFLATAPGLDSGSGRAPERIFWNIDSLVAAIRERYPDFQRPAGDYDSWYLRAEATNEYLRGFENWERVDGALVRFMIAGPLHWLGMLDLGWAAPPSADPHARLAAFRYSEWAAALLHAQPPHDLAQENAALLVRSDARLSAPRLTPRAVRYQIARFSAWEDEKPDGYRYRITPGSLRRARLQGLKTSHLLALLQRHAPTIAPSLVKAIERWERLGVEARFENVVVLRLSNPELLQTVRGSKAGRFLGEPLGPTAVIVKPGALDKVLAILAELGYLGEVEQ